MNAVMSLDIAPVSTEVATAHLTTQEEYLVWNGVLSRLMAGQRWPGCIGLGLMPESGMFAEAGDRMLTPAKSLQWWTLADVPVGYFRDPKYHDRQVLSCRTVVEKFGAPALSDPLAEVVVPEGGEELIEAFPQLGKLLNELAWSKLSFAFQTRDTAPPKLATWKSKQKAFLAFLREDGPSFPARRRMQGGEGQIILGGDEAVEYSSLSERSYAPAYYMATRLSNREIWNSVFQGDVVREVRWAFMDAWKDGSLECCVPFAGRCTAVHKVKGSGSMPHVRIEFKVDGGSRYLRVTQWAELAVSPGDVVRLGDVVAREVVDGAAIADSEGNPSWHRLYALLGRQSAYQLVEQWVDRQPLEVSGGHRLLNFDVFGTACMDAAIPDAGMCDVGPLARFWSDETEAFVLPPIGQRTTTHFKHRLSKSLSADLRPADEHVLDVPCRWY